jgi:hypothetical protein
LEGAIDVLPRGSHRCGLCDLRGPVSAGERAAVCGDLARHARVSRLLERCRVSLPTLLTVGRRDGAFVFLYTYDDGNGKVVRDRETVTVDPTTGTYVVDDGTPGGRDVYRIDARDGFTDERTGGTFVALGSGTENGAPVDVRETVGITPTVFTMLRETRLKGTAAAFAFRHRYRFSRITAQP